MLYYIYYYIYNHEPRPLTNMGGNRGNRSNRGKVRHLFGTIVGNQKFLL